ncbi:MAG TPA: exosortase A [Vicinamibacterales bacterium]|nr:exosortase A [Vicinamibacterales bacterium]
MVNRHVLAAGVVLAAVVWTYAGVMSSLVAQWASDDNYSHGFIVLPIAALFAWERRERLRGARPAPSPAGAALVLVSLVLFALGRLGAELFLTRVSLVGIVAGAVLFVWGREHFRILLFPLAFLLLMIPLPAIVFNQIAFPLQLLASEVGEVAIASAGIPVLREGNILELPGTRLEVAEACSGIRSLVSLLTLAIVLAHFSGPGPWRRVLIVASAVPIAILANAARVAGTGLTSHWLGEAAAQGFFHGFSGWLIFVVAFLALLAVQRAVSGFRSPATRLLVTDSALASRRGGVATPSAGR